MKETVWAVVAGAALGFVLSNVGFSSWDEVHRMFILSSPRLFVVFGLAVLVLGPTWRLIRRTTGVSWPSRRIHPGIVPGGVIFGAGWALSGACPSVALVQLGEGQLGAVYTLIGILLGNYAYSVAHERYFSWPAANCADD